MPKPKNKQELLDLSKSNFNKLLDLVKSIPPDEREKNFTPDKLYQNIRDILAHLHHWNLMMKEWYDLGMSGQKPDMPAKGYSWKTLPDLNKKIWEMYSDKELNEVINNFKASFNNLYKLIQKHSDEELFEKKRYAWTGSTSLAAYLISSTSSHYDWAIKRIKKAFK